VSKTEVATGTGNSMRSTQLLPWGHAYHRNAVGKLRRRACARAERGWLRKSGPDDLAGQDAWAQKIPQVCGRDCSAPTITAIVTDYSLAGLGDCFLRNNCEPATGSRTNIKGSCTTARVIVGRSVARCTANARNARCGVPPPPASTE
jgi:hypothetical protein